MNIKKHQSYNHNTIMNIGYTYEIDGDIDFFEELKKMSHQKTCSESQIPDSDRCLITDEKLRKDHITLECGHKFNYVPLFKDVLFQKCSMMPKNVPSNIVTMYTKNATLPPSLSTPPSNNILNNLPVLSSGGSQSPNVMSVTYNSSYNLETTKLQYNEMKCPYCRSITQKILPYYPYPDVCKVKYVNNPPNMALPSLTCEYDTFINGKSEIISTSEAKICKCLCTYNEKYDLMLCSKHLNKIESGSLPKKQSSVSESKPSPIRTRSRAAKKKLVDTDTTTILDSQNVIVSHHNPATTVCSFTLLSGPRKGMSCGKSMWIPKLNGDNTIHHAGSPAYCKVHYEKMKSTSS